MAKTPRQRTTKSQTTRKAAKRLTGTAALRRHVIDSLVGVAPHAHTGKRVHRQHTSHGFLFIALLFTGILLFSNLGALRAFGVTTSGSVNLSVSVVGAPPTAGASITFPITNSTTLYDFITVRGDCTDQTLVVIYNKATFAGSTVCSGGQFSLTITLNDGVNILQARNYDGLDQPGPVTDSVIVRKEFTIPETVSPTSPYVPPSIEKNPVATTEQQVVVQESPVVTPTPEAPTVPSSCSEIDDTPVDSLSPNIAVGCIQREVFAGETLSLPLLIKGGLAPFALAVDWGDEQNDLLTILDNKQTTLAHTYATGGFHEITMKATDSSGSATLLQTTVSVNGDATTNPIVSGVEKAIDSARTVWVEAPVPMYIAAVAMAIGFWVGDIFERFTAVPVRNTHRTARRHS